MTPIGYGLVVAYVALMLYIGYRIFSAPTCGCAHHHPDEKETD